MSPLNQVQLRYALLWDPAPHAPGATSAQCSRHSPAARAARAAVVVANARRFHLSGLRISWPMPGEFPAWGDAQPRFENGGIRCHAPAHQGDEAPFHALWARQVTDSHLDLTRCTSSDGLIPLADLDEASAAAAPGLTR
jgi:hypothetical protein